MQKVSVGEYFKSLKVIHVALLSGAVIFSFLVILIIGRVGFTARINEGLNSILKVIAPVIGVMGIMGGAFIFKKNVDQILMQTNINLGEKLQRYKAACILRWALLEGPMLFCTVILFLTGDYYYIIVSAVLLVFYVLYAPSKNQVVNHLQLSNDEQISLEDEYAEV